METIVIVHGTFAETFDWWLPGSDFCRTLDRLLGESGCEARCWSHVPSPDDPLLFRWSGLNSEQARVDAAEDLAAYLAIHLKNEDIERVHIIAHSHGGNIVANAL